MYLRFHSTRQARIRPVVAQPWVRSLLMAAVLAGCNHGPGQGATPAQQPDHFGVVDSALTPGVGKSLVTKIRGPPSTTTMRTR